MKYAVIKLQGKQYRVEEGQKLSIDRMEQAAESTMTLKDVILYVDEKTCEIGTPTVSGATVKVKVLSHEKAKKVRVATFKAKSKERKTRGHRQFETTLEVQTISVK